MKKSPSTAPAKSPSALPKSPTLPPTFKSDLWKLMQADNSDDSDSSTADLSDANTKRKRQKHKREHKHHKSSRRHKRRRSRSPAQPRSPKSPKSPKRRKPGPLQLPSSPATPSTVAGSPRWPKDCPAWWPILTPDAAGWPRDCPSWWPVLTPDAASPPQKKPAAVAVPAAVSPAVLRRPLPCAPPVSPNGPSCEDCRRPAAGFSSAGLPSPIGPAARSPGNARSPHGHSPLAPRWFAAGSPPPLALPSAALTPAAEPNHLSRLAHGRIPLSAFYDS